MARTQLSIASFNLYNLQQAGRRMYPNSTPWTAAQYKAKIAWGAKVLTGMRSDVWGFQELWANKGLDDLLAEAGMSGDYTALAPQDHNGRSIVCAAVVKSDILHGEPEWIRDFPEDFILQSKGGGDPQAPDITVKIKGFSRPVLHFRIRPRKNGKVIHVYCCHLKSKSPTWIDDEDWFTAQTYARHRDGLGSAISTVRRTAEAAALRMILVDRMKGNDTPVIVLGDLNDGQHSNTLNIVTGQPKFILSGLDKGGVDDALYTVGALQQYRSLSNVYYTHIHENVTESLDHVLVSREFYDNSRNRLWAFKGMELMNDHLTRPKAEHKASGSVDHGIVRAKFEYRPAK